MTIGQRLLVPFYQGAQQRSATDAAHRSKTRLEQPKLLACSASRNQKLLFSLQDLDRKLCEDRKAPFEHLYPGNLAKSVRLNRRYNPLVLPFFDRIVFF